MTTLRIASAQLNPTVGDISGNLEQARAARAEAAANGADLVVFPELFILGYPPEDLVLKPAAVEACREAIHILAKEPGIATLIGSPWREDGQLFNAVILIDEGEIKAVRYKHDLPNYAVFDEKRVFAAGPLPAPVNWRGMMLGLPICEDIWLEDAPRALAAAGADFFISINGSPWRRTIETERREAFMQWADVNAPLVFVNQVGGQDELVFDGASFAWNAGGKEIQRLPVFETCLAYSDWTKTETGWTGISDQKSRILTGLEA